MSPPPRRGRELSLASPNGLRGREAGARTEAEVVLGDEDASLLDVVDNVLSKGVVLTGDLMLSLAKVDLVYARLSLLLCAADRVFPGENPDPVARRHDRHAAHVRAGRSRRRSRG